MITRMHFTKLRLSQKIFTNCEIIFTDRILEKYSFTICLKRYFMLDNSAREFSGSVPAKILSRTARIDSRSFRA